MLDNQQSSLHCIHSILNMDPYVLDTFIYKSSIRNAIFRSNKRYNEKIIV